MDNHHYLQTALVFLLATVIAVPLTKRFRLGSVLGYLLAGVVIGPQLLGLVGDTAGVSTISEFGIVLMLFVIGLELSPQRLWVMRRSVFGTGLLQVLASSVVIAAVAYFLEGLPGKTAVIAGGSLALSSTAFGLQILAERKEVGSAYGRQAFAILLFQDLAAIPLIAMVPLLATASARHGVDLTGTMRTIGVIVAVVVGGRYLLRPVFRFVAKADAVEVSTATALLVVMGTAWLMELAGVSATLGAFLAGVLLADSEYRHDLESHLEPFKGLLLGLFFISVGMSMDLSLLLHQPLHVLAVVLTLMLLKGALLWPLGRLVGGLDRAEALRLAVLLACGGEFAFVVLKLAQEQQLLNGPQHNLLVLAISLSMALTPLLVAVLSRLLGGKAKKPTRAYDTIDTHVPRVIIAGYGRMGQIVARVLRAQSIPFVALDHSVEQMDLIQRFGNVTDIFYGDPARPELLRAAQADKAEVFVLASDDPESSLRVARVVRRQYPHLKIIARARNRQHVWRLMDLGVDEPVRETLYSSLKMTKQALVALGLTPEQAVDRVERFRRQDAELIKAQYLVYDDETKLVQTTREALADLERLFEADASPEAERVRERDAGIPLTGEE
ncbi:monovalent cation:proton antiporter-2 (CPA2) family protein [Rhodanobacter spathiphylli]|uniref:Transporter, monovalent cation:proton antiporter-2 (CPA2) family protein n=1 Tax=Rhodanobacter spathiphylli B39 TaxID=1163407 RepID=I4W325_9GAMM|nr:monovalent cation:proton antiporter-2 (CPA2) family protein [Rhodanobacter spathiphylli]EIL93866.1 transporter, monovalent cation:proton antiporter-2 (CPA2) family protein [Rhodanobacter spathiphylli B39]